MKSPLLTLTALLTITTACAPVVLSGGSAVTYSALQERTVGHAVDDTAIVMEIKSHYVQADVNELVTNVAVEAHEGRVLLTGIVKDPDTRVEAVRLAWQPYGVKEVINEIQVSDKNSLKQYANDAWITSQLKAKMLLNEEIRSINYTVETVRGVVYLMGVAQHTEELERVKKIAGKLKGVKQVISHVIMKNDPQRTR